MICKGSIRTFLLIGLFVNSTFQKNVTQEIFGELYRNGFPIAYADFNKDHLTDVVFLSKNYSSFEILFGSIEYPFLQSRPGYTCNFSWGANGTVGDGKLVKIVGFSMADFTGDGNLDFLISFVPNPDFKGTLVAIIRGNSRGMLNCRELLRLNKTSDYLVLSQEPLIVDVNGDMIADLLGETVSLERKLWLFEASKTPVSVDFPCPLQSGKKCPPFSNPTSNSFVDIDGDFSPELVLISTSPGKSEPIYTIEIHSIEDVLEGGKPSLLLQKSINLQEASKEQSINVLGGSIFMDIGLNGRIVQIIPYCRRKNCIQSSGFLVVDNGAVRRLDVKFQDNGGRDWSFIPPSSFSVYSQSIILQTSDLNLDGYPDMIGTLRHDSLTRPILFINVPCNQKYCKYPRTFELDFETLSKYNQSISATFFEKNDIMITQGVSPNYTVEMFRKTYSFDAYFIRWMMTTGIYSGKTCHIPAPGCSMKYNMTTNHGTLQTGSAVQFYRSSHFPLNLPYTLVGVGVSSNFVEQILFGKSESKRNIRYQEWKQIIPNSQLIVIPNPVNNPKQWKLKNYLTPSESGLMNTLRVLLLIFVFLVSLVILLWVREMKEDRMIRRSRPENHVNLL